MIRVRVDVNNIVVETVEVTNVGPTNGVEGEDEGGVRRYEVRALRSGIDAVVEHARRDGYSVLLCKTFAALAALGARGW